MNKKNIFQLSDIKSKNEGLRTLLDSNAGNSEIAGYIRDNYFEAAYYFAGIILQKKVRPDSLNDEASSLAVNTMEDIITSAVKGRLNYSGDAEFSTYLYSALMNKYSGGRKFYYPSEVKRKGIYAMEVYRLLYVEKYTGGEIVNLLKGNLGITEEKIRKYVNLACSFHEKECVRKNRNNMMHVESYDHIIETSPHMEAAVRETPLDKYLKKSDLELLFRAVSILGEPGQTVIKGYYLEKRWRNIKEMEADLGLKNGSYELKKAREKLSEILKKELF